MLLFLIFTLVNADNDFVIFGLDTSFKIIPGTSYECLNDDLSCFNETCNLLKNNISYVAYALLTTNLDCYESFSKIRKVEMVVFGIDENYRTLSASSCHFNKECLIKGCHMHNKNNEVMWILYTGKCF